MTIDQRLRRAGTAVRDSVAQAAMRPVPEAGRRRPRRASVGAGVLAVACALAGLLTLPALLRHQGPVKVELGGAPPSAPTGGPPPASAVPPPPATTTPAGGYAARWVGRRFVPRPGTEPVPGVSLTFAVAVGPEDFGAYHVREGRHEMLWFERDVDPSDGITVEILDAIDVPGLDGQRESLEAANCRRGGVDDPEIAGIVPNSGQEQWLPARLAWRLNRQTGKIETLPPAGVECHVIGNPD